MSLFTLLLLTPGVVILFPLKTSAAHRKQCVLHLLLIDKWPVGDTVHAETEQQWRLTQKMNKTRTSRITTFTKWVISIRWNGEFWGTVARKTAAEGHTLFTGLLKLSRNSGLLLTSCKSFTSPSTLTVHFSLFCPQWSALLNVLARLIYMI